MTYEHYPQAIEGFVDFAHNMAEILNELLIVLIGGEAAWENHIGIDKIPDGYLNQDLNDARLIKLWELREEANSLLLIENDHHVKQWAETISEVNEELKAKRKQIAILEEQARSLHNRTIALSGEYTGLRVDCVGRLRAINFLIASSIRDGNIGLAHWRRDERLKHLQDAVSNQINDLDKSCHSYTDDF